MSVVKLIAAAGLAVGAWYGTTGAPQGQDGVASYFNGLQKWRSREVQFTDVVAVPAGADVINVAGIANFVIDEGATTLSVKITWVIVREDGDWKIVSHHVSSRGALI